MAEASENNFITLVMIGVTGVGKSATANSILGSDNFKSQGGFSAITKTFGIGIGKCGKDDVKIIDIPGLQDTETTEFVDQARMVVNEMSNSLIHARNGFDALLVVYPFTRRWKLDDKKHYDFFVNVLEEESFAKKGILVITHGDSFRRDCGDQDISDWIKKTDTKLRYYSHLCDNRCVLFNNVTKNQEIKDAQIDNLMNIVKELEDKDKLIPPVCIISGVDREAALYLYLLDNIMTNLVILDQLVRDDENNQNKECVMVKGYDVHEKLIDAKIYKPKDPEVKKLLYYMESYDGSIKSKTDFKLEAILPLLVKIDKLLKGTGFFLMLKLNLDKIVDSLLS